MTTTTKARKAGKAEPAGRTKMAQPQGALIDLAGIEAVRGYGDHMQVAGSADRLELQQTAPPPDRTIEHEAPGGLQGREGREALVEVGEGHSRVFAQPLHLTGVQLNGVPSSTLEMGLVLQQRRYFFNTYLLRGQDGQWAPAPGAPAQHQWHVVDRDGRAQHPDLVKQVFDVLQRAAELYYRARYRDFVLAELAWFNNAILEWDAMAAKVKSGKATKAETAAFYKIRFSGHMASMKEGEARILEWLKRHPA